MNAYVAIKPDGTVVLVCHPDDEAELLQLKEAAKQVKSVLGFELLNKLDRTDGKLPWVDFPINRDPPCRCDGCMAKVLEK